MKRYIRSAENLTIPSVVQYFSEVDANDIQILKDLMNIKTFNGKLFSVPSKRNELGKTPYYDIEDKCIHLVSSTADSRTYDIPYTQYDRGVGEYRIYTFRLTIYDDRSFQFGNGKIRKLGSVSDSTLSSDCYKAKSFYI